MTLRNCEQQLFQYVGFLRQLRSSFEADDWAGAWHKLQQCKAVLTCDKCRADESSRPPCVLLALEESELRWNDWRHPCHRELPGLLQQRLSPPVLPEPLKISKVLFTHDAHSSTFRNGEHAGKSVNWLSRELIEGRVRPSDPAMRLNVVHIHGCYHSLNNRHAAALLRFAQHEEQFGRSPPECIALVWPLVRGLLLEDGSRSEVVSKFFSAYSTTTRGRDAVMKPTTARKVSAESKGGKGRTIGKKVLSSQSPAESSLVVGWIRCKACHTACVPLSEVYVLLNVHQPADGSTRERLKQVQSLFAVAAVGSLQNCNILPHPEKEQMPFKLGVAQCVDCSAKLANIQDASVLGLSRDFGSQVVCLKCSEIVIEFSDCKDSYVGSKKWVSYRFALQDERKVSLVSVTFKEVLAQQKRDPHLRKHLEIVSARVDKCEAVNSIGHFGNSDADVSVLVEGIRRQVLKALIEDLHGQLEKDLQLFLQFLEIREQAVRHVTQARTFNEFNEYEFNNIYARFYMRARAALGETNPGLNLVHVQRDRCLVDWQEEEFSAAFEKLQSELREKNMPVLPQIRSFQAFAESCSTFPGVTAVLQSLHEQVDNDMITFTYQSAQSLLSMKCPCHVMVRMKKQAHEFLLNHRQKADAGMTGQIFLTTVLNYIMSSSGLLWGLGQKFYDHAHELGGVLECYASPFNSSLSVFCSPCAPLDIIFGSLGSFHSSSVDKLLQRIASGSLIVVAPPYIESELSLCSARVSDLVGRWPISAACIYPDWSDASGVRDALQMCAARHGRSVRLAKSEHMYFDYETEQNIISQFPSLGFVFAKSSSIADLGQLADMFDILRRKSGKGYNNKRAEKGGKALR